VGGMKKFALVGLILIAFALRIYRLDSQDLWGDEAFSIFLSQMPLDRVVAGAADTHPPLYPVILFFWLHLFGSTVFATRILSVVIGTCIVPLVFVFAKRATATSPAAWFSTILATVSPLLIYYSQETRMYELVTLLALASSYFLLRLLVATANSPLHLRAAIPYLLTTALAIYTHYSAFYILVAQNIFTLIELRKRRAILAPWLALQATIVAVYIPWILVQTSFLTGKAGGRWDELSWSGIEMIFGKSLVAFGVGLTVESPLAQIESVLFLALAALGIYSIFRAGKTSPWSLFALLCCFMPLAISFLVNPILPFFFERYVLVALPGFYVILGIGMTYVAGLEFRAAIGVAALIVGICALSLMNYYFNDAYAKGKYGRMMSYISSHAQADDAIVLNNPLQKPLYLYYAPSTMPAFFLPEGAPLEDPSSRAELEQIARTHSRIWLVMFGNPAEYDPTDYLKRWLGANTFKSFFRGFVDADLTLYEMPHSATIKKPVNATLGEGIKLLSYDLDRAEISPGRSVELTLHWQSDIRIAKPYVVFAHLIGGINPSTNSLVWAQMDNEPVGGSRATTTWKVGEVIDDRYGLQLPDNTPPGEYEIEVGMYDASSGARVPVIDWQGTPVKENRVLLGVVKVGS
jgi:mannosyltransferase